MKDFKIHKLMMAIDSVGYQCPIDDIILAKELIKRNAKLIEENPSLESIIRGLTFIIEDETERKSKL